MHILIILAYYINPTLTYCKFVIFIRLYKEKNYIQQLV